MERKTRSAAFLPARACGGQLWPLSLVARLVNPFLAGRYRVGGMTLLVSRGTGTWGPRMRLWRPGGILLVVLRAR